MRVELLLVRHGIAEERDPSRWPDDRGRPLTAEGAAKFRKEASLLGSLVPTVDRLLTSDLTRATQTADILHEELGWPAPEAIAELSPGTSSERTARILEQLSGAEAAALVGHEPDLSELASYLLTGDSNSAAIELKKGGVISLGVDPAAAPGDAVLYWSIPPRVLRGS
jgi:phosphohistidine phosphatase